MEVICFFACLFISVANAAEIASMRYVHELLEHNYGVYVPVNDTLTDADLDVLRDKKYGRARFLILQKI